MVEDVQSVVGEFIHQTPQIDLQLAAGKVAMELVSRSQTDDSFYPRRAFLQLLDTRYLCYRFEYTISSVDTFIYQVLQCISVFIHSFVLFVCFWICSVCPELLSLAMVKRDFQLCQSAFQIFPDIPEAVTCAYLKTILR